MGMSRFTAIASGAVLSVMFAASASAIGNDAECTSNDGTIMDIAGVKHCFVPIIPEEFQGEEYANEIKGVKECTGTVRKTSIGDFCLIPLEAKPAPTVASTVEEAAEVETAITETADEAAAEKPRRGLFGR